MYHYRLQNQLVLYIKFLTFCTDQQSTFKLLDEIHFLRLKITLIERLSEGDLHTEVRVFNGIYPSKMNE